jgi:hypothetical protein
VHQQQKEALKDPAHEDHESCMEWSGGNYDSEQFVNRRPAPWQPKKSLRRRHIEEEILPPP